MSRPASDSQDAAPSGPDLSAAIAAQLRRAPRHLSPATAARIRVLLDVPAPDLTERGIRESLERGKKPGPDVERRVVAFASPFLTERDSGEPPSAA